jgi:hypothetical protein
MKAGHRILRIMLVKSAPGLPLRGLLMDWNKTLFQFSLCLQPRPAWVLPLLAAASYSVAVNMYVVWRVGFTRLVSMAIHANAALGSDAVLESAAARRTQILIFQGFSTFAGTFITALIVAKVLWLVLAVTGDETPFRRILAVVARATFWIALIRQSMLALTLVLLSNAEAFDIRNPLATNPAFFLRPTSPAAFRCLSALDVLTITNLVLLAVGISKASGRLSFRGAFAAVFAPWAVYTGLSLVVPAVM